MKKYLITWPLLAAFGLVAQTASAAGVLTDSSSAATAKIIVTGKVVATTCEVGTSDQSGQTVALNTVKTTELANSGATAAAKNFQIALTNCTLSPNLQVRAYNFSGVDGTTITASGKLSNTAATPAANVVVELLGGNSVAGAAPSSYNVLDLNNASLSSAYTGTTYAASQALATNQSIPLYFQARYYATAAAGAGDVKSTATFNLEYQ